MSLKTRFDWCWHTDGDRESVFTKGVPEKLGPKIVLRVDYATPCFDLPGKKAAKVIGAMTEGGRVHRDTAFQLHGNLFAFVRIKQGTEYRKPTTEELQYCNYLEFGVLEWGMKNIRRLLKKNSLVGHEMRQYSIAENERTSDDPYEPGFYSVVAPKALGACGLLLNSRDLFSMKEMLMRPVFAHCGEQVFIAEADVEEKFCAMLEHIAALKAASSSTRPWGLYLPKEHGQKFKVYVADKSCTPKTRSLIREFFPDSAPEPEKKSTRKPSTKRATPGPSAKMAEQFSASDVLISDGRKFVVITNHAKKPKS